AYLPHQASATRRGANFLKRIETNRLEIAMSEGYERALQIVLEPNFQTRRQMIADAEPASSVLDPLFDTLADVFDTHLFRLHEFAATPLLTVVHFDRQIAHAAMAEIGVHLHRYRATHQTYP